MNTKKALSNATTLGARVRLSMKLADLTSAQLAAQTGLSEKQIQNIYLGVTKNPRVLVIAKIAEATGQSIDFLARGFVD